MIGNPYKRRAIVNRLATLCVLLATGCVLGVLGLILFDLLARGFSALSWSLFVQKTPAPGDVGGLANALCGSLALTGLGMLIAIPVGLLGGTYLAEYGRRARFSAVIRFVNDILLSAPSICVGLFVYEVMVKPMRHFSGLAGAVALALIAIPIILRTTEDMLILIPDMLREAAAALGAPRWHIVCVVCFRGAKKGILTGILLATARIAGETAPLLFTVLNNAFWSLDLTAPMANLPVTIYQFALSPYDDWHRLAWAGAVLITGAVLFVNVLARLFLNRRMES